MRQEGSWGFDSPDEKSGQAAQPDIGFDYRTERLAFSLTSGKCFLFRNELTQRVNKMKEIR